MIYSLCEFNYVLVTPGNEHCDFNILIYFVVVQQCPWYLECVRRIHIKYGKVVSLIVYTSV